jgi:hypothetical protein
VVLNRAVRRSEIRPDTIQRLLKGVSWVAGIPEDPWMANDRAPSDVLRRPGLLEAIRRVANQMFPPEGGGAQGRPASSAKSRQG